MNLPDYIRPKQDNSLGIHLFPHPYVTGDALRPWLDRVVAMRMRWVTTLNVDYASLALMAEYGLQPCVRPFKRANQGWDDVSHIIAMMRQLGVGPYIQIYNEPELAVEWDGGEVNRDQFIWNWLAGAENVHAHGGYPGIQLLDPEWLRALIRAVKSVGREEVFDRAWFCSHNYASNHPSEYPYDSLNPGKTVQDDWFCWLNPLKFEQVLLEELGRYLPCICGEGGWCIGDAADNRYPTLSVRDGGRGYELHRDYHLAGFRQFQTGVLPNGEPLPDWWFAVTPWLLASQLAGGPMEFEENAWYSENLSGTKTLTIEAVKALPPFWRRFSWDGQPPEPEPTPPEPTPEEHMPEYHFAFAEIAKRAPKMVGKAITDQIDVVPNRLSFQISENGLLVYQDGHATFIKQAPLPKAPSQ